MNDAKGGRHTPATSDTIEFQVIGELKANPHHLLLLGDDGACYDYDVYDVRGGEIAPLAPDDSWVVDVVEDASLRIEADSELPAPRACYGLWAARATNRWSIRQVNATKCNPATVSGKRS